MMLDVNNMLVVASQHLKCDPTEVEWYSWPEVFPSTGGPRGGVGGQMMSSFQVFAFQGPTQKKVKMCSGLWKVWNGVMGERW